MHPYHTLTLQEWQPPDFEKRCNFCIWFKDQFGNTVEEQPVIFFMDEAWFHLYGYVNCQNYRIWSENNPHVLQQTSLHFQKVRVLCEISKYRVIGPMFHKRTVNSE